ncbi:MAG: amidohydrolase family protein [Muribaculaceae bacterium]|nr:amidohydrolase family protein [Muribaculaceae bacterium]
MKIIALEEHLVNKAVGAATGSIIAQNFPYAQQFRKPNPADAPNPIDLFELGERRILEMDKAGIDMEVVSYTNPTQWLTGSEGQDIARQANDELAQLIKPYPERFRAFATLAWGDPAAAADELRRTVKELGFVGTLLSGRPQPGNIFLDDKAWYPMWEALTELDLPIYIHPNYTSNDACKAYYDNMDDQLATILSTYGYGWHYEAGLEVIRMILGGVFEKFPTLKVLSGHWGEMVPYFLPRLDQMFKPEVTGLPGKISDYYKRNVWVTPSGVYDYDDLQYFVCKLGIEHLAFSADWPYVPKTDARTFLTEAPISDTDKEKFSHLTAEKLLHL